MIRESEEGIFLDVELQPNSKKFQVDSYDPWIRRLKIRVMSSPIKGKANKELVSKLSKMLNCKVQIVNGEKSTKKTLLIKENKKEVKKRLGL